MTKCQRKDEDGKECGIPTSLSVAKKVFPNLDRDVLYLCREHEQEFKAKYGFKH
jgi:hypothetical protein